MQDEVKSVCVLPHIIFVYGTLKRGQPNGHVLEEFGNHQFLGTGCTDLKYPLVIDKDANLPFMLDAPGKGQNVYGEVYCVDDKFLARLDHFEGHPYLYRREVIMVRIISRAEDDDDTAVASVAEDKQEVIECSTYLRKNFDQSLLNEETFASYDSSGPHGRPYMPEYDSD